MSATPTWFYEVLNGPYAQAMQIERVLYEKQTDHQHLMVFEHAVFGRVLVLDGVVQTTEGDEFIYHEMFAHVPLFAHPKPRSVLIVGGGDGGLLREVCRHTSVDTITMVEIDGDVVEWSKTYLPQHSQGAFDDPRLTLVIDDGQRFVRDTDATFDVILSDSTDPIGPGEALFTTSFYEACQARLKPGGVLVTQNGVSFLQLGELQQTHQRLQPLFEDTSFYAAAVPTYVGGNMHFAWATDNPSLRQQTPEALEARVNASGITGLRYYHPGLHTAAFALPQYVLTALAASTHA